ncbi:hypothetical protein [Streptomyces lavendofoliae]|uniref:hypothetical protein n=1 Tax=Streptomyces lavendofoliae TaxID=67314 RepID=UPI00300F3A6C
MDTLLTYLVVTAFLVLLTLPSLVGHARDRAVDRQLRRAEHPAGAARPAAARPPGARPAAARPARTALAQKSSSRSTEPSTATW